MARPLFRAADITQPGSVTRWLVNFLHIDRDAIVGCTETEVDEVEATCGRPLPLGYKQWLREAGRQVGPPRIDDHFRRAYRLYPDVIEVRNHIVDFMEDVRKSDELLSTAFPFYSWEGYRICLLDLSGSYEDPPVLQLDEAPGLPLQAFHSLSRFIGWDIFVLADVITPRTGSQGR